MKTNYTRIFALLLFLQAAFYTRGFAQCADGSSTSPLMMDTTIYFETGVTSTQVKFPQFDPANGMVTCVKLTVTMIGVIDSVTMQNKANGTTTANFYYVRTDEMTGPGLTSMLSNSVNKRYGPYTLTPYDGNMDAGTDFVHIENDTAVKAVTVRNLTDSTEISKFYGHDSVTYNYDINVMTSANIGGTGNSAVATSALVKFRFEYCVCPKVTLPIGLKNFTATKTSAQTVSLSWDGENDEYAYTYDVEVSRDGRHFSKVATLDRKFTANPGYLYSFALANNDFGRYFFRVRQHWLNGYVRYTPVKTVELSNPIFAATALYPNPTTGNVGIKFVNVKPGRMLVQISHADGRQVAAKEITVSQTDYQQLAPLAAGMYWVKITDLDSKTFCVKQLLVQ